MHFLGARKRGEAAIGSSDDVFAADDFGVAHDAFGHQLRMLDENGGVRNHARYEDFAVRQLNVLPNLPFVFMPRIGGFERIGAGADLQDNVDDILELHVMDTRAHIDAVAGVEADFFRRDVP